jgi:hypothetical protein
MGDSRLSTPPLLHAEQNRRVEQSTDELDLSQPRREHKEHVKGVRRIWQEDSDNRPPSPLDQLIEARGDVRISRPHAQQDFMNEVAKRLRHDHGGTLPDAKRRAAAVVQPAAAPAPRTPTLDVKRTLQAQEDCIYRLNDYIIKVEAEPVRRDETMKAIIDIQTAKIE